MKTEKLSKEIILGAYKIYKETNPDNLRDYEMFETKDKPTKTYRFFTQEEFIDKIKTDDGFANKWVFNL